MNDPFEKNTTYVFVKGYKVIEDLLQPTFNTYSYSYVICFQFVLTSTSTRKGLQSH